ncbi:MAG TPA: hypothetical protein DCZ40_00155 [Lachnospiraceae bacterium]|nr:hypothetical protein [Lachnospiraceae bacterium]
MNVLEKDSLIAEAKMQIKALKKINEWKRLAMLVSAIGVAVAYAGISVTPSNLFLGIPGIFLTLTGIIAAAVINLGLKNGRRNVEKMLWAVSKRRNGDCDEI